MTAIENARRTLTGVEAARSATRDALDASWLAFLIWGTIVLASAPFTQVGDGSAVGFYWFAAAPLGLAITWRAYQALELRIGVEDRHGHAYAAIAAAMVIGATATGVAGQGSMLSAAGPLCAIGAGLLAMATVKPSGLVAASGTAMLAAAGAIAVAEPADHALVAALAQSGVLLLTGTVALARHRGDG